MILLVQVSACASRPDLPVEVSIEQAIAAPTTVSVPYAISEAGQFYILAGFGDGVLRPFIIDTGATQSVIYEATVKEIGLEALPDLRARVFGMVETKTQPLARLPELRIGTLSTRDLLMAILPDPDETHVPEGRLAGVLGLDVMSPRKMFFDVDTAILSLISAETVLERSRARWDVIPIVPNPYSERDLGLGFMRVRIGLSETPALIDTGSSLNLINWNISGLWQLSQKKRDLQRNWEINGALGSFRPRTIVELARFNAGQKTWEGEEFTVIDFTGLDVLELGDNPMMIAGAPLFRATTFLIDFPGNEIWIRAD